MRDSQPSGLVTKQAILMAMLILQTAERPSADVGGENVWPPSHEYILLESHRLPAETSARGSPLKITSDQSQRDRTRVNRDRLSGYRDSHDKDETFVRPSYQYNGSCYPGETTSLYQDALLDKIEHCTTNSEGYWRKETPWVSQWGRLLLFSTGRWGPVHKLCWAHHRSVVKKRVDVSWKMMVKSGDTFAHVTFTKFKCRTHGSVNL